MKRRGGAAAVGVTREGGNVVAGGVCGEEVNVVAGGGESSSIV